MSEISTVLSLPYIMPAQAQKHVTHNEAIRQLDLLVQLAVTSRDLGTPPDMPEDGSRFIVGPGAGGAWAGQTNAIALYTRTDGWLFTPPQPGWRAWIVEEGALAVWAGTEWETGATYQNLAGLGVNAASDEVNRLSVSSPATLLTHEGGSHQLKINKAATGDTASILFQTDWSGRAEMGTAGADGFAIKVSADGAAWTTALTFDPATGAASGAAVQQGPDDTGPGRLARAEWVYGPATVLAPVSRDGDLPTGGVIERGTTADGEFVRFADGTQICTHITAGIGAGLASGALYRSAATAWTFPRPFAAPPALSGNVDGGSSWVAFEGGTAQATSLRRYGAVTDATARKVRTMAVGRWA